MRRLHVIQLLPALDAGGVERSTLEIAQALTAAGHRASVVSAGGRLLPALQSSGATHVALDIGRKSPLVLRHVPALRRLFATADVVHARSRLPAWLAWLALRGMPDATRPHFVTSVHGLNSPSRYSAILTSGERVECVSEAVRAHVLRHYPATDPARLVMIPRGVDPAAFPRRPHPDPQARARVAQGHPALGGDGPLLLLPGRGTRLKGHADAIALLARLRADGLDARLWLAGALQPGRERYVRELQAQAHAAGVAQALAITAPTAAIAAAYAASDLVLQLSRQPEAFGRSVLEAWAVGRPVLGWAHGGVGESLQRWLPEGALAPLDLDALVARARAWCLQPPPLPATMPPSLQAMQEAGLALYHAVLGA
ncbi:MAG: glycosyltransferase [Thermomonas sp.]